MYFVDICFTFLFCVYHELNQNDYVHCTLVFGLFTCANRKFILIPPLSSSLFTHIVHTSLSMRLVCVLNLQFYLFENLNVTTTKHTHTQRQEKL